MSSIQQKLPVNRSGNAKWLELVIQNLKSLHFGVLEMIVHDSHVIQIERTERIRLENAEFHPQSN